MSDEPGVVADPVAAVDPVVVVEPVVEPVVAEPEPQPQPAPQQRPQMVPVAVVADLREKKRNVEAELEAERTRRINAEALAERLSKGADKTTEPLRDALFPPAPQTDDIDRRAAQLVFSRDVDKVRSNGLAQFGPSFMDTIRALSSVDADKDGFVSQVMAVDMDQAHVLLKDLTQDLEKTDLLVKMDPNRRIVELTKMAVAAKAPVRGEDGKFVPPEPKVEPKTPPKQVSKAPAPPPPIEPSSSKEIDGYSDEATDEQFTAKFEARMKERAVRGRR